MAAIAAYVEKGDLDRKLCAKIAAALVGRSIRLYSLILLALPVPSQNRKLRDWETIAMVVYITWQFWPETPRDNPEETRRD